MPSFGAGGSQSNYVRSSRRPQRLLQRIAEEHQKQQQQQQQEQEVQFCLSANQYFFVLSLAHFRYR